MRFLGLFLAFLILTFSAEAQTDPVITWANPADITYGTPLDGTQLNATADVPGSFVYTPDLGTVLNAGLSQVISVEFTTSEPGYTAVTNSAVVINVNKASLTVTANDQSKEYGDSNPTFTIDYSGFVNGDTDLDITPPSISTTATTTSNAGSYVISLAGGTSTNYTLTLTDGTLTITPAALNAGADNKTKVYGDANPPLTITYSGFKGTDNASSLTSQPTISTAAATNSNVGSYGISLSGGTSSNYTLTLTNGALSVTPAVLSASADDGTKVYGDANPTFTISYTGFKGTDNTSSLTSQPTISTTAVTNSNVGSYVISLSGGASSNYTFTLTNGTLTITPAALSASADNKSKIYGDVNPALTITYSGFKGTDNASSLTAQPTASTTAATNSNVGSYGISLSGGSSSNYAFTLTNGTLTVTTAPLSASADSETKVYGDVNPTLTITYSGFKGADNASSLTSQPTISTTAATNSNVGSYGISLSGGASSNYTLTLTNGTLTITPAALSASADSKTKVYGDVNPVLTISYTGFKGTDNVSSLTSQPTISTTATTNSNVGSYGISLSGGTSSNYTLNLTNGTLTITPATLSASADNKTKVYGDVNPLFTITYIGFKGTDNASSLTSQPTISTTAATNSNVGSYGVSLSGGTSSNYTLTLTNGTLTITPAALSASADNKTKVFGDVNPTLTITYSGFKGTDNVGSLTSQPTISTTATTISNVGSYGISLVGGTSSNYTFTLTNGTLTITPAALSASADNKTKVYGDVNPTMTITYAGFKGTDNPSSLTSQPVISTTAATNSNVGSYGISLVGGTSSNYTLTLTNGTLTITPAALSASADNKTKVYGDANPTLTITYSGFKGTDNASSLTSQPTISTIAATNSNVGIYAISLSGGTSSNYTLTLTNGTLTITPAALSASADNKTKVYDDVNPTLTISYTGFKGTDNVSSLTSQPSISTTAVTTSNVGAYPISLVGGTSSNYTFTLTNGTLTITPASLNASADNKTKIYGDVNPVLTITYTGFKGTDNVGSLTSQPTISTTATTTSNVGSYVISLTGGTSSNYTFTLTNGALSVTKATVTATSLNASRAYNVANPVFTIVYSGFVNGETASVLDAPSNATTTATISSPVGTYSINTSGGSDGNYSFAYVNGTLTINKADPVITWSNPLAITYGTPLSSTQLNAGANVPGTFAYTPASGIILNAGAGQSLSVNFNPVDASNYNPIGATVLITVNKATPVITWPTPLPIKVNEPLSSTQLNATSNSVPGTFVYTPSIGASFGSVNTYTLSVAFTPTDASNYNSVPTTQVQISVNNRDNPVVTWSNPSAITYGTPLSATQLNASANVPGTYVYTPSVGTLLNAGSNQNLSVSFTPTDGINYNTVVSNVVITVNKASLTATAVSTSRIYGASNPTFSINYTGFVNGESAAVIDTAPTVTCAAINGDNAGTIFPIIPSGGVDNNYLLTYVNGALTITKAPLTAKADNKSRSYGLPNPPNTITYTGFVNGDTESDITQPSISTTATVLSNVGTHPITLSGGSSINYNLTLQNGVLTINASALIAKASDLSKSYGQANPTLTIVYSGFLNGDDVSSITPPSINTTANTTSAAGSYPITLSGGSAVNYGIILQPGTMTITKATLTVTAVNKTRLYGASNPTLTVSYTGFVNGDTFTNLDTAPTPATSAIATTPVGLIPITVSGGSDNNYDFVFVPGTLNITKAMLTATANNQSRTYGASNPTLTFAYLGFVNGETSAVIDTPPVANTTGIVTTAVGTVPITVSGGADNNYDFTYVSGVLSITKAMLTATANNQGRTYGAVNPILTISYSGFLNGETSSVINTTPTIATSATATSPIGTYPITLTGGTDNNYAFTLVNGVLTISKALLTAKADDKSRQYGLSNPTFTITYTGFVNGENASSVTAPTPTSTATPTSIAGPYTIAMTGGAAANYTLTLQDGTLTITKAPLTVTANNKTRLYGATNPTLTVSYSGFVNGDTFTNLDTAPTPTTSATNTTPVGTAPITVSGGSDNNYNYIYAAGTLTITKAMLTATATNQSRTYGAANPTFTISYAGFLNGESASVIDSPPVANSTGTLTTPVGTAAITVSGGLDNNYDFTYASGTLTITKALLTATANNLGRVYGAVNPTLTISYSGFANSETSAVINSLPTAATTAVPATPVGTIPITVSGGADNNYDFNYVPGTLTITKAMLTVTANNQGRTYGAPNPSLTINYSGFVNGETSGVIDTAPSASTTATTSSPVGTYSIAASGGSDGNYGFNYVSGNLIISKASLTATAANAFRSFQSPNPSFVINYSGFVNSETSSVLDTPPTATTTATMASPTGVYAITVSGGSDNNYAISNVNGVLTINDKITPTITWANPPAITYGTALAGTQLNATTTVSGSFTYTPPIGTILSAGTQILSVNFVPTDGVTYNPVSGTVQVVVNKATPVITWSNPSAITYGTPLSATQLNASASVPGAYVYSPLTGTILNAGSQTLTVNFTPTDASNYNAVNGTTVQITVNKSIPVVTWPNPAAITYGVKLSATQLNATANVAGSFTYTPASGVLLNAGSNQNLMANFIPTDAANYNTVNGMTSKITVNKAPVTVTANDSGKLYGADNPTLGMTFSGFVNGENSTTIDVVPNVSTTAINTSNVGSYPITVSGGNDNNYFFNYVAGVLSINKAMLQVNADNKSRLFGVPNPVFTETYTGFANSDNVNDIDVKPIATTQAVNSSNVGSYAITLSGGSDNNYELNFIEGILTINKAVATVSITNSVFAYDGIAKTATITTNPSGLQATVTYSGSVSPPINPGKYGVNATINETNYEGAATGILIINRPPVLKNFQVQAFEDSQFEFSLTNFTDNFSDDPGDQIVTLRISSLPINGKLQWKGRVVSVNDIITTDNGSFDIFSYSPNTDYNGSDSFTWNASDGFSFATTDATITLKVNGVNDAPLLSTTDFSSIEYSLGDPAISVGKSMIISDVDNATIFSASVAIEENYTSGDELSFKQTSNQNLKATFDKASGKMTLTGKDSKSNYEAALANVMFNSSITDNISLLVKKIAISVRDSSALSNIIIRDIQIAELLPELKLVNSFTPNGDGVNDVWDIVNLQFYKKVAISIFDHQGVRLHTCDTNDCSWNGKSNGKIMPFGSYFYVIDLNDGKRKYQGTVTILK